MMSIGRDRTFFLDFPPSSGSLMGELHPFLAGAVLIEWGRACCLIAYKQARRQVFYALPIYGGHDVVGAAQ